MFQVAVQRTSAMREADEEARLFATPDEEAPKLTAQEEEASRHRILMECLEEEGDLQAEERQQMQIDDDYYDHRQWRPEDARIVVERHQAPMVYNQSRMTIDWLSGTEKRTSKDFNVLPRRKEETQPAEVKKKILKYTDDVNKARHHRSTAFKDACNAGLGWLEVTINTDPEEELLLYRSENWRNMYRDSRDMTRNQSASRYNFRRKKTDLDYACALFPDKYTELCADAYDDGNRKDRDRDVWWLGQNLTNAAETDYDAYTSMRGERSAYIGSEGNRTDRGRRRTVDLIEAWYRVPKTVQIMNGGPFHKKEYDEANPEHQAAKAKNQFTMYSKVKMVMRVMVCTMDHVLWDGPSPFNHNRFPFVPVWGYRRSSDGMAYGVMRGMRDAQDSLNKKMAKANFIMSSRQIVMDEGAHKDIEELRDEVARPDGIIIKQGGKGKELRFEPLTTDFKLAMEMADRDQQQIRDSGGVTNENLGRDTNSQSGKAILAKQDQGSLTTFELFDNLLQAMQDTGQLALSLVEQFYTEEKVMRIVGGTKPIEWLPVNRLDPATGQVLNDITASEADYIVDSQDYRASLQQASAEQLMDLMTKLAPVAPNIVMAILDLMVDNMDIPNKDVIVDRVRQITGMTDPEKELTPEQMAKAVAAKQEEAEAKQLQKDMAQAQLAEVRGKVSKMGVDQAKIWLEAALTACEAANIAVTVPGIMPAADSLTDAAGLTNGPTSVMADGAVPETEAQPVPQAPVPAIDSTLSQPAGAAGGAQPPTGAPQ